MADLQYPIGKFVEDPDVTPDKRQRWIGEIAAAPGALRAAVAGLDPTRHQVIYVANPAFGTRGLYVTIVRALGAEPRFHKAEVMAQAADLLAAEDWRRPYSREQACFPAKWLRDYKFWPAAGRIDNVYGDRNLVCSCAGMEACPVAPGSGGPN